MARWVRFPWADPGYLHEPAALRRRWKRLHVGDAEPLPRDAALLAAWAHFHAGEFRAAYDAALALGPAGVTLANKAQALQATYLERTERTRLAMYDEVARRALAQQKAEPANPAGWFWHAYALGRRAESLDLLKLVAERLAPQVRQSLEHALKLAPRHPETHLALATFHAEAIARVGRLLAMTEGADASKGLTHYRQALALNPASAIVKVEVARGLLILEGEAARPEARRLLADAARHVPADALERLELEAAKLALQAAA